MADAPYERFYNYETCIVEHSFHRGDTWPGIWICLFKQRLWRKEKSNAGYVTFQNT